MARSALAGIRVLDLSTVLMGPMATQILADLGADVIRVESFKTDSMRTSKPYRNPDMAGTVLNLHRNKRSIVIDLKRPEGHAALMRLARTADVFVHNMRHDAAARLKIDYAEVRAANPEIVYCAANGYGRDGPYAGRPAYDDVIQAASGVPNFFSRAGVAAQYVPMAMCDKVCALTIAYALMAALIARLRGEGGQEVEVPMYEVSVAFNLIEQLGGAAFDPPLGEIGWARMMSPERRPYPTKDGHVCILPYSRENWREFFRATERADLADAAMLETHETRIENTDVLYAEVAKAAALRTTAQCMTLCERLGIPAAPVRDIASLWDDAHLKQVGLLGFDEHPTEGRYRTINMPVKFSKTPAALRRYAPKPGEDSAAILAEAGFSAQEQADLLRAGAIGATGGGRE